MRIEFGGRRALVTGAGKGIGRAVAARLAACGARVVAVSSTEADLRALQGEIGCETIVADLADAAEARAAAERAGEVDLLVNNEGISIPEPFLGTTVAAFDATMAVNVRALLVASQVVAAGLIRRGRPGAIVNVSSQASLAGLADHAAYGASTVGLCHGVQGAHWQITRAIDLWARHEGLVAPDETLHRRDVAVVAAGINHQTWFATVAWRGMDMVPRLLELFEAHPEYPTTEKVRIDVLRRYGYYSTESNGHLSEYLPWNRKRPEEIGRWIDLSSWINGETGGYLRVCTEGRWFETDFPAWMAEGPPRISAGIVGAC